MAQASFTQVVTGTTFLKLDPASSAPPVQTCSFTFAPPFHDPEFISVLSVRRRQLSAPLLEGTLVFGASNAAPNAGSTIFARHDKWIEINGWARLVNGFALKITYEDSNKSIVDIEKVAVARSFASVQSGSTQAVAALASEEDGASDQMVVLMSEESVSIEGVVALSPPLSPLDLEPGQHVAQGK